MSVTRAKTITMQGHCPKCGMSFMLEGRCEGEINPAFSQFAQVRAAFTAVRRSKGLSFNDAAREIGTNAATLWRLETGQNITAVNAAKVQRWLGAL